MPPNPPDSGRGGGSPFLPTGVTWESLVIASGGGWLPPDSYGDCSPRLLGLCLGKSADTVRNYVDEHELDVRKLGDEMLIPIAEIRAKVPAKRWETRKVRRKPKG